MIPLYLPIAGVSVNMLLLMLIGGGVGFLSGLFGVGGGFLLTPLLMFLGIPAPVAVASGANQVVGASVSGVLAHWRRGNVDVRMGVVLVAGGFAGSWAGVLLFAWLQGIGQLEPVISLIYVLFLGIIGIMMLVESLRSLYRHRRPAPAAARTRPAGLRPPHNWPLQMHFPRSGQRLSLLLPLLVGLCGGLMSALLGIGGGIILVPMMLYLLRMPTAVVIGTSLFQVMFVSASVTVLQAIHTKTVDIVLMLALLLGGVIGAQFGARFSNKMRPELMRLMLSLLVLVVSGKLLLELLRPPADPFSLLLLAP